MPRPKAGTGENAPLVTSHNLLLVNNVQKEQRRRRLLYSGYNHPPPTAIAPRMAETAASGHFGRQPLRKGFTTGDNIRPERLRNGCGAGIGGGTAAGRALAAKRRFRRKILSFRGKTRLWTFERHPLPRRNAILGVRWSLPAQCTPLYPARICAH